MSFTSPRDVYLSAAARGVSYLGDFLAATALVLALQARGAGAYAVAAVLIAAALPTVLLAPVAGRVVDRFDSRTVLTSVGLAQAACCAAMAYAGSVWLLVALAGLLAAGLAFTTPTFSALLPDMAGPEGVGRAMAIGQTAVSAGALAGPALAGLLVELYGLRVPLLIDAATYLAVVGAGLILHTRRIGGAGATVRSAATWRVRSDPLLTAIIAMVGALIVAVNISAVALVFFVRDTLGGSAGSFGLIEATWTGAMLLGGWLAASRARRDAVLGRSLIGLHLVSASVIAIAGLVPAVAWLFPLWLLGGVANGVENNYLGVLAARRVPAAVRGQFFARVGAVANGANLIGFGLAGFLVDRAAPGPVMSVGGLAGMLVVVALAVPVWRAARTTATTPQTPTEVHAGSAEAPEALSQDPAAAKSETVAVAEPLGQATATAKLEARTKLEAPARTEAPAKLQAPVKPEALVMAGAPARSDASVGTQPPSAASRLSVAGTPTAAPTHDARETTPAREPGHAAASTHKKGSAAGTHQSPASRPLRVAERPRRWRWTGDIGGQPPASSCFVTSRQVFAP